MKKFCLIFILVIAGAVVFAQSIVVSTKLWSNVIALEPTGKLLTEKIKFTTDTTINLLTYKLVERTLDSNQVNWTRYGFIREDSDKRVFYKSVTAGPDMLLYSLNMGLNDSVIVYGVNTINFTVFIDSAMYHVTKIDSMQIGGNYRKQLHLSGIVGGTMMEAGQWIDSMGGMNGILHNWNLKVGDDGYNLLCFSENGIIKYQNPNPFYTDCYINTGIEKSATPVSIALMPNPANDKLMVEITNNITSGNVTICNEFGKTCLRHENFKSEIIDVSGFSEGIYFLQYSDSKTFAVKKFIIRR